MRKSNLLPTPTVNGNNNRRGASPKSEDGLLTAVRRLLPTPQAFDALDVPNGNAKNRHKKGGCRNLSQEIRSLTSFPVAFPARDTALQDAVKELVTLVISGRKCGVSLAKLSLTGVWLKMCQDSVQVMLDNSLEEYSGTWPRWGIMSAGVVGELAIWERHTDGRGSLLLATPNTMDSLPPKSPKALQKEATQAKPGRTNPANLRDQISNADLWQIFATPQTRDYRTGQAERWECPTRLPTPKAEGYLSSHFVTWMQGLPLTWFDSPAVNESTG